MSFYADLSLKNHCSHAYILSITHPFCKKHVVLLPIFYQKNNNFLKARCSHVIFISNFHEKTTCFYAHDQSKKRHVCQWHTLLGGKKGNRMPLFSKLPRKNHCSYAHSFSININSLISKLLSCLCFVKNVLSLKT